MFDIERLKNAMADLEEDEVLAIMEEVTAETANDAVTAMQQGMDIVGTRFEDGEYFVGDLIYAGEVMTGAMETLKPLLAGNATGPKHKMILCTVKDDLHDMLEANDFDVLDLGIDVPAKKIVETARSEEIKIIALSGVLTLALDSMKEAVEAFKAAGIRDNVKIIIGGSPVSESACVSIGADEWAHSPQKTVSVCKSWL